MGSEENCPGFLGIAETGCVSAKAPTYKKNVARVCSVFGIGMSITVTIDQAIRTCGGLNKESEQFGDNNESVLSRNGDI